MARPSRYHIDTWPYRHWVREVMSTDLVFVEPECVLTDAAAMMVDRRISSVLVDREGRAGGPGIITERDVVRALASHGSGAFGMPSGELMSTPLTTVEADDPVHVAMGRMTRLDLGHLAVRGSDGALCGILTSRLLTRHQSGHALVINDELKAASNARDLSEVHGRLAPMTRALVDEGESASRIAGVISSFYRRLSRRAVELAEAAIDEPAGAYAFVILGSAGRGESLLAGDQDNAIVSTGKASDAVLERIASKASDLLDAAGLPYCKGGVMASRAPWRRSIDDWQQTIAGWAARADGTSLLNVDIFFDLVHIHGERPLVDRLRALALEMARTPVLPRMMAQQLQTYSSPLGLFGGLRTTDGRFDLKLGGLFPLVAGARAMALRHGIEATATRARLAALSDLGLIAEADLLAFGEAHEVFLGLMLRQQIRDLDDGHPPGPGIDPRMLSPRQRRHLRRGLRDVSRMPGLVLDVTAQG